MNGHRPKGQEPERFDPLPVPTGVPPKGADSGMLTDEDRRKARDCARMLLRTIADDPTPKSPDEIRNLAAAIRDLDAVARGPIQ